MKANRGSSPFFRAAAAAMLVGALAPSGRAQTNWAGPYVGINGGYGWGKASTSFPGDGDSDGTFGSGGGGVGEPPDGDFNQALHREVYGLHFGYNVAMGRNFYGGFEALYDQGNILALTQDYLPSATAPEATTIATLRINSLISVAPQLGWAWDRALFRAKGGLAAGRVVSQLYSSTDNGTGAYPTTYGQDQTRIGWTWGLGVDYALSDHWIAGLAYDYYDLGTIQYGGLSNPDDNWPLSYAVHPILRTASVRLSYKFGAEVRLPGSWTEPARAPERARAAPLPLPPVVEEKTDPTGALIEGLKAADGRTRADAAVQLGELHSGEAVEALIAALGDKLVGVRGAAADALGKIGNRRASAPLVGLLGDPNPKVRALAARSLGALGDSSALPSLKKAAHDRDPLVRRMADAAIKKLNHSETTIDDLVH